jgi:hypothetical protein
MEAANETVRGLLTWHGIRHGMSRFIVKHMACDTQCHLHLRPEPVQRAWMDVGPHNDIFNLCVYSR